MGAAAKRLRNGGELERLQRWMQACVMAEGPVERAIETAAARREYAGSAPGVADDGAAGAAGCIPGDV